MLTHFSISQCGQSHIDNSKPCQDFSDSKKLFIDKFNCEIVIAAIADGVGSCEFSQYGSQIAVTSFINCVEFNLNNSVEDISDETILRLIQYSFHYALSEVQKESDRKELPFVELDSTLTGVVSIGSNMWFGHIGDDGIVALYTDGKYEMITKRHKGEYAHSMYPLRETSKWEFGKVESVASCVLMTDGVLDYCVDDETMNNRVYFPFLKPALTASVSNDDEMEKLKQDWDEFLAGEGEYDFRSNVTDDITFVLIQNTEGVKHLKKINFDFEKWDIDTAAKREKQVNEDHKITEDKEVCIQKEDNQSCSNMIRKKEQTEILEDPPSASDSFSDIVKISRCAGTKAIKIVQNTTKEAREEIKDYRDKNTAQLSNLSNKVK